MSLNLLYLHKSEPYANVRISNGRLIVGVRFRDSLKFIENVYCSRFWYIVDDGGLGSNMKFSCIASKHIENI